MSFDSLKDLAFKHNKECAKCKKENSCNSAHVYSNQTTCINFEE